jgi:hypothetical protein
MANYRQPRAFNSVSLVLLLLGLAAGYWMWVFFPFYWDAWTVDHQLREGASQLYRLSFLAEPERSKQMRDLLKKVQADSIRLGKITDPEFDVTLEMEGDNVTMRGTYQVRVKHPIGNWVTVLHMDRQQKANTKKVQWD